MRALRLLVALVALVSLAPLAGAVKTGRGLCDATWDLGSNAWLEEPFGSSGGYQLWTPTRAANYGSGTVLTIDTDETSTGFTGSVLSPDIPGIPSNDFALHFSDGRTAQSWENLLTWVQEVKRIAAAAGKTPPIMVAHIRADLLSRNELSRNGAWAPTANWILRTDRTLTNYIAAFRDNGAFAENASNSPSTICQSSGSTYNACGLTPCRYGYNSTTLNSDDIFPWTAAKATGCGMAYTGINGTRQFGSTVYDLVERIQTGLGDSAVYYNQRPGTSDKVFSIGQAVLANEQDSGYRTVELARSQAMLAAGFDAVYISHKNAQFTDGNGGTVQHWPKISGDGLGGKGANASTTINELRDDTDASFSTMFSGPPELPSGVAWDWSQRSLGDLYIHQDHDNAGVPVMMLVDPYWYFGCPEPTSTSASAVAAAWAQWDSYYDDTTCSAAKYGATESARLRQMVARADYVLIALGGNQPVDVLTSGDTWTYYKLKAMLESVASPDGTPPKVLGFYGHPYGGASTNSAAPKSCADTAETNPVALSPCGNGVVNASEGCDDGGTSDGDGCSSTCTVEPASTITPSFTITKLGSADAGTTCVAPCVIRADARDTTATGITRPWHSLAYEWTFGDSAAASENHWHTAASGISRDEDVGPEVGHIYNTAGTYTVTLTVRNPDNSDSVVAPTQTVTVTDPNTYYGDSRTWCFSTSGNFAGCPLDDDSDGTCEAGESSYTNHCVTGSNFNTLLTADAVASGCNVDAATSNAPRCLFKGGETFTTTSGVQPSSSLSTMATIGTFGSGRANVTFTGNNGPLFSNVRQNVNIHGFAVTCTGSNGCGLIERDGTINNGNLWPGNFGISDSTITGRVYVCMGYGFGGYDDAIEEVWFVGNTCTKTGTETVGNQYTYIDAGRGIVYMDNDTDAGRLQQTQLHMRWVAYDSVVSHNWMKNSGWSSDQRGMVQFRAGCGGTVGGSSFSCNGALGGPNDGIPITHVMFNYNKLGIEYGGGGQTDFLKFCNTHSGCISSEPGSGYYGEAEVANNIAEGNLFYLIPTGGTAGSVQALVQVSGGDTTVRNNIFDLRGAAGIQSGANLFYRTNPWDGVGAGNNIHYFNNTVYMPVTSTSAFSVCGNFQATSAYSGHECRNNFVWAAGQTSGTRTLVDTSVSGWTGTGNTIMDGSPGTNPFTVSSSQGAMTADEFIPAALASDCTPGTDGNGIVDCGTSMSSRTDTQVLHDYGVRCRPVDGADADSTAEFDIGAWERGASACP